MTEPWLSMCHDSQGCSGGGMGSEYEPFKQWFPKRSTFAKYRHHFDLWLPCDSGLIQSSMQDGFNFKNRLHTNIGIEISDKNVEIPPRLWTAVAKKVKTKDNVSESTKNYEKNKRQRAFQNSWKQGRTWLVFDNKTIFCSVFMIKRRRLWMCQ